MKRKFKHLTPEDFDRIKELLSLDISANKAGKLAGRAPSTIWFVRDAETFEDYKSKVNAHLRESLPNSAKKGKNSTNSTKADKELKGFLEPEYSRIKSLLALDVAIHDIAKLTKRSTTTVARVKKSSSYAEYRDLVNWRKQNRARVVAREAQLKADKKAFRKIEVKEEVTQESDSVLLKALSDNTQAMRDMALAFNHLIPKLDEVIETKRPWLKQR